VPSSFTPSPRFQFNSIATLLLSAWALNEPTFLHSGIAESDREGIISWLLGHASEVELPTLQSATQLFQCEYPHVPMPQRVDDSNAEDWAEPQQSGSSHLSHQQPQVDSLQTPNSTSSSICAGCDRPFSALSAAGFCPDCCYSPEPPRLPNRATPSASVSSATSSRPRRSCATADVSYAEPFEDSSFTHVATALEEKASTHSTAWTEAEVDVLVSCRNLQTYLTWSEVEHQVNFLGLGHSRDSSRCSNHFHNLVRNAKIAQRPTTAEEREQGRKEMVWQKVAAPGRALPHPVAAAAAASEGGNADMEGRPSKVDASLAEAPVIAAVLNNLAHLAPKQGRKRARSLTPPPVNDASSEEAGLPVLAATSSAEFSELKSASGDDVPVGMELDEVAALAPAPALTSSFGGNAATTAAAAAVHSSSLAPTLAPTRALPFSGSSEPEPSLPNGEEAKMQIDAEAAPGEDLCPTDSPVYNGSAAALSPTPRAQIEVGATPSLATAAPFSSVLDTDAMLPTVDEGVEERDEDTESEQHTASQSQPLDQLSTDLACLQGGALEPTMFVFPCGHLHAPFSAAGFAAIVRAHTPSVPTAVAREYAVRKRVTCSVCAQRCRSLVIGYVPTARHAGSAAAALEAARLFVDEAPSPPSMMHSSSTASIPCSSSWCTSTSRRRTSNKRRTRRSSHKRNRPLNLSALSLLGVSPQLQCLLNCKRTRRCLRVLLVSPHC
jgi:hypothetical protein